MNTEAAKGLHASFATSKAHLGFLPMSEQTNPVEPMSSEQLMRWARQERNALMADYVRSAAFHLASPEKVLVRARTRIMSFCYRIERLIVVLSPMVPLHSGAEAMAFVF